MAFIGGAGGIAGDYCNVRQRQIEFFGRDLRERGENALTELNLAGEDRGGPVGVDP